MRRADREARLAVHAAIAAAKRHGPDSDNAHNARNDALAALEAAQRGDEAGARFHREEAERERDGTHPGDTAESAIRAALYSRGMTARIEPRADGTWTARLEEDGIEAATGHGPDILEALEEALRIVEAGEAR